MAGESKRDYPASILHQSPWYREYHLVETWFSRVGYFRSMGKPCCDLLVLNPVESVWGRVYPGAIKGMGAVDPAIKALDEHYARLFHILAGNHIDFDYAEEALLGEHGAIGQQSGRPVLSVGAMSYGTVLVSGLETLRLSTLRLLRSFLKAGGKVIFSGEVPSRVDAIESEEVRGFSATTTCIPFEEQELIKALEGHASQRVRIVHDGNATVAREVFCQLRRDDKHFYLLILNTDREKACDIEVQLEGCPFGVVEEWNLETGEAEVISSQSEKTLSFHTRLETSGLRCFKMVETSALPRSKPVTLGGGRWLELPNEATYRMEDENICVLDIASWSVDGGAIKKADEILKVDRAVRRQFGVPVRAGDMVQPWFRSKKAYETLGTVHLSYALEIGQGALSAPGEITLALETPELFDIAINGAPVDTSRDEGFWCDIAFRKIRLPKDLLREGANEISVRVDFREDINLEAMYLLGHFAVRLVGTVPCLGALPEKVTLGDLVGQGFPYYSGSFTYTYPLSPDLMGKRARVVIPAYEGAYARVRSGGQEKLIPWRPNQATIEALGAQLEIEVCVTRKNTFGPLHLKNPRPGSVGPGHFIVEGEAFSLEPVFIESGLLKAVGIEVF